MEHKHLSDEILCAYLEKGALEESLRSQVTDILNSCDKCRENLGWFMKMLGDGSILEEEAGEDLDKALQQRTAPTIPQAPQDRRSGGSFVLIVIAAIGLILIAYVLMGGNILP